MCQSKIEVVIFNFAKKIGCESNGGSQTSSDRSDALSSGVFPRVAFLHAAAAARRATNEHCLLEAKNHHHRLPTYQEDGDPNHVKPKRH
jgi:hypothetical protein